MLNCTEDTSDHVTTSKKICLGIQSSDRRIRRQAYIDLREFITRNNLGDDILCSMFYEIHIYILSGIRDNAESVRSQTIQFLNYLIVEKLPLNDFYLTYIFPVLLERIGSAELIEESEEIRFQLVQFLNAVILKYSNSSQLKPFLNDCILILAETVKDKYPAVKELSCTTIVRLAKALPNDFHKQAESLIKPVLSCLTHQRYKVRLEAVNAVGEIIIHSTYKGLDEVVGPLAERLFDQIYVIRLAVAKIAGRWLLEYRDRYSYFYKILPLILTCLNDDVEEIRLESTLLWEKIGTQYQEENEKDLKDELDYLFTLPKYYPENMKRPNLGCRILIKRNVSKLSGAICRELTSWQEDIRFKCSQLLCVIVLHAEEGITQNLQDLLPAIYSAARDDDSRIVTNIFHACEIIGHFVKFHIWSKLLFPVIEDGPHYGHLTTLAGLIKGSPKECLIENIEKISNLLADDSICCNRKKRYQLEMLHCLTCLIEKCDKTASNTTGFNMFKAVVTLLSLRHPDIEEDMFLKVLEDIAVCLDVKDSDLLWRLYTLRLLEHINNTSTIWTITSDNACMFLTILYNSKGTFLENWKCIEVILNKVFDNETDAELKLKTLCILADIFQEKDMLLKDTENLNLFLLMVLTDVLIPSLIWHAGTTAEAIRTMAALCLQNILVLIQEANLMDTDIFMEQIVEQLLPLLTSLLEDASYRSRKLSAECLTLLKQICCLKNAWSVDSFIKIYPELLKRLDDPVENVRLCALKSIMILLESPPEEFKANHYKAHHEIIIDTLLTHFDDEDVQDMICDAMEKLIHINKELLLSRTNENAMTENMSNKLYRAVHFQWESRNLEQNLLIPKSNNDKEILKM
ncbi:hypothetical protein NQ315_005985 [Exocentrus adspersus]|uniref:HEAT repeat-containing protein 2 n=1 Tax=Exocentrus adspersus TaxID=1586481 RepID=A0AAV8VBV8_9CUCU|nr:hypothetical protein NQ315_005985 [Exocentrus adspersus]